MSARRLKAASATVGSGTGETSPEGPWMNWAGPRAVAPLSL